MNFRAYIEKYDAFIFELDDVLYPQKDYLLQVYYLFAQFIEYSEQLDATDVVHFMKAYHEENGIAGIFEATSKHFRIPQKYENNFAMLLTGARLPLKLLLFDIALKLLQDITIERKKIILFTSGNPQQQLNKIRQTEWHGLEKYLTVYFDEEIGKKPAEEGIDFIVKDQNISKTAILLVGKSESDKTCAENADIDFLNIDKLLLA